MYVGIIIATLTSMIRTNNIDETFKDYSYLLFFFIIISVILSAIYTYLYSNYIKNTRSLDLLIATIEYMRIEMIIKKKNKIIAEVEAFKLVEIDQFKSRIIQRLPKP